MLHKTKQENHGGGGNLSKILQSASLLIITVRGASSVSVAKMAAWIKR